MFNMKEFIKKAGLGLVIFLIIGGMICGPFAVSGLIPVIATLLVDAAAIPTVITLVKKLTSN